MTDTTTNETDVNVVDLMTTERDRLVDTNQKNVEVFNELQRITARITNSLSVLDGAIAGISEFVTAETTQEDAHVTRLEELRTQRQATVDELRKANSQRTLLITTIQATEMSLGVLNNILQATGVTDLKKTDLTSLKTEEQAKQEVAVE